jgi:hypothetical protein
MVAAPADGLLSRNAIFGDIIPSDGGCSDAVVGQFRTGGGMGLPFIGGGRELGERIANSRLPGMRPFV